MRPALALALCALAVLVRASAASSDIPWPSYCGEDRPIPPLDASIPVTLMQAQVIVRHGDRTPAFNHMCWVDNTAVWECDMSQLQLSSVTPWETTASPTRLYRKVFQPGAEVLPNGNCGLGQLTTVGYNQHIKNGQYLRDYYVDKVGLIPPTWLDDPSQFHLRSDNALRTEESGQALFSGLYPEATDRLAAKATSGIPVVPFYVEDEDTDTMTYNPTRCPGINNLTAKIAADPKYVEHIAKITTPLAKELTNVFGLPVPPTGWTSGIATKLDCLMTHRCHNFSLPAGVTPDLFAAVIEDDTWTYGFQLNYTGFVKLAVGTFMGELLDNMKAMIATQQPTSDVSRAPPPARKARKFWVYAGHDDGPVMPMMAALGAYHGVWSPYATLIALELYNSSSGSLSEPMLVEPALRGVGTRAAASPAAAADDMQYYVRAIVLGEEVKMPFCSAVLCPIAEFEQLVASLVPTEAECLGTTPVA